MKEFESACAVFGKLQNSLCSAFEGVEKEHRFVTDNWHSQLGKGSTRVLQEGDVWEKAGIGFSNVAASELPPSARAAGLQPDASDGTGSYKTSYKTSYRACGVSAVMHPRNPYVPASHFNVRFFTAGTDAGMRWWFGGGFDLTPCYPEREDCHFWHSKARTVCEEFGAGVYDEYKNNCDKYFYLPHRKEMRGIGGLFFDNLSAPNFENCLLFARQLGETYRDAYLTLTEKNKGRSYGDREREFLCHRRGRYVEFNLLYDRGTRFGLESGGRVESVLMSMPPLARWHYGAAPSRGEDEGRLKPFLRPQNWCS